MNQPTDDSSGDTGRNPYAPPVAPVGPPEQTTRMTGNRVARRRDWSVGSPAPYHLDCSCGLRVPVRASEAGSSVACECGASFACHP